MEHNSPEPVSFRPRASLDILKFRAKLLRVVRGILDAAGFTEVQTPVLSRDTVVDRYVEPLSLTVELPGMGEDQFYLLTSPEFAMKRLLASGLDALYQITPVFRRLDRGPHHNIEFTMLEWYRAGDSYCEGIGFLRQLIDDLFREMGCKAEECAVHSLEDVLFEETGLSFASGIEDYRRVAQERSLEIPESFLSKEHPATLDNWFDLIFSETIQSQLGLNGPVILFDYPVWQSQLAQTRCSCPGPYPTRFKASSAARAERFELFADGLELANGYHELLDANELRRRNAKTQEERIADGHSYLATSGRLLAAMDAGLPPSCGCALGIDRLLMVLLDTKCIDDVIAFPIEDA